MTMRSALGAALVVGAFLPTTPVLAQGQGGGRENRGRLDVNLSTTAVSFPTPTISDFDVGWVDHPGITVSVLSRPPAEGWELRLRADGAGLGGYGKPVADLYWRTDRSSSWMPLATTDQAVLQGTGDTDVTIYFRTLLSWTDDPPDSYGVGLTFSVSRP